MKVGSAVLAVHIVVAGLFAFTQGCVTTESQGSSRAAGARHKGPWKHEHKGGTSVATAQPDFYNQGLDQSDDALYSDPLITSSSVLTPVEPSPSSAPVAQTETYIVQKGDILSQLAVDFDTTTATLVALNNLTDPDVLYVGQELLVPAGRSRTVKSSAPVKSQTAIKKGGTYTIQKGDTLSEIAQAAGVSINDLRSLNNIKDDVIFAGDEIDIPSYGKVPAASRESTTVKPAAVADEPAVVEPEPAPLAMAPAIEDVPAASEAAEVGMVEEKVVYPGETLDDIAGQYGITKAEIMRLNGIADEAEVKEGTTLRIPIAE